MEQHIETLEKMRESYENVTPPEEGIFLMKGAISRAREQKKRIRRKRFAKSFGLGAVAVLALLVIMPNVNRDAAYAMSNVPVLRGIVEAFDFKMYEVETVDLRYSADVTVPKLVGGVPPGQKELRGEANLYDEALNSINMEADLISRRMIQEFTENMEYGEGYEDLVIKYEILKTTENYFTLKLITYVGAGSGYEKDYFYTVDLKTGRRIQLSDLFVPGSDYVSVISENIKEQMREQMAESDSVAYWLEGSEYGGVDGWNFNAIDTDQSFYINESGQFVITFSEGEVGPMSMGTVEFVIPKELTDAITEANL